ncbi:hypothetical protein [Phytoactinopolyspora endophytica]|uniref:hypothetical protein n=1 Tax=Phytoactinopolyspora endophytica TaxID=1642495 RepID=UPI00101C7F01|nr:hypothetical protein [Phytoactinopolyspora endophytica]
MTLAGCSGGTEPQDPAERPEIVTKAGVTALVDTRTDSGMDAEVVGELVVGPGDCLALDDGLVVRPVIWPEGSTLADDGQAIEIGRDGPTVRIGEYVEGGGGEIDPGDATYTEIPESCLPEEGVAVALTSW